MPNTRWAISSLSPWTTLPDWRRSHRQSPRASIRPSRRSAALSSTAPPSELPWYWSNWARSGLPNTSWNSTHCVVVEWRTRRPPSVKESCVNTAFLPHGGLRFPYSSRIIQASRTRSPRGVCPAPPCPVEMRARPPPLVAQRLDRIERRGASGGPLAEQHPDRGREGEGDY